MYSHTYTCACILYGRCVCVLVCAVILTWATDSTLCVQPVGLWHRGLFHVTQTGRGFEWSGGLEPGLAHCCPLSGAPGSQSTPGRPGLFAPALGKCFTARGWQPEVAAQREAGPLPTRMVLLGGQQCSPVGGKMVLTATQSGATPKRAEVFGEFADFIALNSCQGEMWAQNGFMHIFIRCPMYFFLQTIESTTWCRYINIMFVYLETGGLEDTCLLVVGYDTFCEEGSENIQMN